MNIVFFAKRQYTGKDVIDDQYGRLYEIPLLISEAGHNVTGICVSYKKRNQGLVLCGRNIKWFSFNSHCFFNGLFHFFNNVIPLLKSIKPDVIIGSSDSLNIIVSYFLSREFKVPCIIDLYDNFESFWITRIPVINFLYRYAIINASAVTCVSQPLLEYIKEFSPKGQLFLLENAVNSQDFYSVDKRFAREQMGLPVESLLIGTLGALDSTRNIESLYQAFEKISLKNKDIHLVLAGRLDSKLPKSDNVHYLGNIDYEHIVYFLNSLDLAIVCLKDSSFCQYCFPQKFYEILACRVPVIATNIGVMKSVLIDYPALLFNSEEDLYTKIAIQIDKKVIPEVEVKSWDMQAKRFNTILLNVM